MKYILVVLLCLGMITGCTEKESQPIDQETPTVAQPAPDKKEAQAVPNEPQGDKIYMEIGFDGSLKWREKYVRKIKMVPGGGKSGKGGKENSFSSELNISLEYEALPLDKINNSAHKASISKVFYQSDLTGNALTRSTDAPRSDFQNLLKSDYTLYLNRKTGEVEKLQGLPALPGAPQNLEKLLADWMGRLYKIYPSKAVQPGDSWEISLTSNLFPAVKINRTCKYASSKEGRATVHISGTLETDPSPVFWDLANEGDRFEVHGTEAGTFIVDETTGLILKRDYSTNLFGTQSLKGGETREIGMEMNESTEISF